MSPRWRKVLADLWGHKARTLLAVLSIAAGVFAVGMIISAYFYIDLDIDRTYAAIHPAHGVITAEPFDDEMITIVERLPGVEEAEGRVSIDRMHPSRMSILLEDGRKHPLVITAAEDPSTLHMDQLTLLSGDWPGKMEMLVLPSRFAQAGDVARVELSDGRIRELRVSGAVQDLNVLSVMADLELYAYVDLKTLDALGLPRTFNRLHFCVPGDDPTKDDARATGKDIERLFSRNDKAVFRSETRLPNRHPLGTAAKGLLGLLAIMGILLLALGGFLVTNVISALLAQQVRQIGIMKAVGARSDQIVGMVLVLATAFGAMALLLAAPLAPRAGYALAQSNASLLNFALLEFRVFPASLLLMLGVGLITPWLAALPPVLGAIRTSVHKAITTYGASTEFGSSLIDRLVERFRGLSRPLLLSLRNVVRRKGRLALTLSTLALAGAIFMAVFTTRASIVHSFERLLPLYFADLNLDFEHAHRTETIARIVRQTPGVVHVEGWAATTGELRGADGRTVISRFTINAPPADSRFISHPPLTEGRWLREGDQNALAISTQITLDHPELEIGDTIRLRINGRDVPFVIVGKYTWTQGDEGASIAHASYSYVSRLLGEAHRARTYRVMTESSDPAFQERTGALLSEALERRGYTPVITTLASAKGSVTGGADAIAASLMIVALLIVGVGGIGLASTMSMNVLERTREIGVMRAIGASSGHIRRLVVVEGVMVGILSWAIALGASFPLSRLLCHGMGLVLLQRPLDYVFDWTGVVMWMGLIVVISALASLWPAANAARLTVRDALAYE